MKDRIRQIMEAQHMTQQVFADFIGTTPATLSGIFNDRTRPSINIVESIKKKIPDINTDWLLFGHGDMYKSVSSLENSENPAPVNDQFGDSSLFDFSSTPSVSSNGVRNKNFSAQNSNSVINTRAGSSRDDAKIFDKPTRHVTEIRVYYDDQTWESFVPSKK